MISFQSETHSLVMMNYMIWYTSIKINISGIGLWELCSNYFPSKFIEIIDTTLSFFSQIVLEVVNLSNMVQQDLNLLNQAR